MLKTIILFVICLYMTISLTLVMRFLFDEPPHHPKSVQIQRATKFFFVWPIFIVKAYNELQIKNKLNQT